MSPDGSLRRKTAAPAAANKNDFDACALKPCGQGWTESHAHASPRYLFCCAFGWCLDAGGERRCRPATQGWTARRRTSSRATSNGASRADGPRRPARNGETACNGSATRDGTAGSTRVPCPAATGDGAAPGTAFRRPVGAPSPPYRCAADRNASTRIPSWGPAAASGSAYCRAITRELTVALERATVTDGAISTARPAASAIDPATPAGGAAAAA